MKSVALHNLGCKVNSYEFDVMQQMLQEKGYEIVPFDQKADIYMINTCTVTNIADRKSRQMIHQAKKRNPDAIVVAVGCYVQTGKEKIEKDECIDLAVGNHKKKDFISILEAFLEKRDSKTLGGTTIIDVASPLPYEEMSLTGTGMHTRATVKIQDGCNQFCTYCVIPYARGRVQSREEQDILREVKILADAGCQEIVLTGIHISSYGLGNQEQTLLGLLSKLQKIQGIERIRLGSLEPRIITEEFVQELSTLSKICPHFHLSLQSGSDQVLKRMNRHYTAGEYYEKAKLLRKYYEMPAITTDVITGFPGETEEEFLETREFIKKVGFYEMHIFKYSKRDNTPAASMENQVSDDIKTKRSNELLQLEKIQSKKYRDQFINSTHKLLIEEVKQINGSDFLLGHTREYVKIAVPDEEKKGSAMVNKVVKGYVTGYLTGDIMEAEKTLY